MTASSTRSREAKLPSAGKSQPPRLLERPATLAEGAYESIAASLMEGGYVPGEKIATRTLAAQLGVSLTPAREAVLRLVREGALELFNARATVVPTLSLDRFKEIYCIRRSLEPNVAKEAAERLTADDIKALERSLERMTASYRREDYRSAFRCDGEFHFRIYEAAGMPLVVSFIRAPGSASVRLFVSCILPLRTRMMRSKSTQMRSLPQKRGAVPNLLRRLNWTFAVARNCSFGF